MAGSQPHVHSGKPPTGMEFELTELSRLAKSRGRRAVTTSDGRTDSALIAGGPVPIGRYELKRAAGVEMSELPFLDEIPLRLP